MAAITRWNISKTKGLLLDIYGVLYNQSVHGPKAIEDSVNAIKRLNKTGTPYRLCSNTSTQTKFGLCQTLISLGFEVDPSKVFCPAPAACQLIKKQNLRPYLLVCKDVVPEFEGIETSDPNCVVLGDATHEFTYDRMNEAFRILIGSDNPLLITLGEGKYYQENEQLQLDVGVYAKALQFATDCRTVCVGKPDAAFFNAALSDMGLRADEVTMIGDDIISDVAGAQKCGMQGVQVRTGKYRSSDEPHVDVTPEAYVNNLQHAIDMLLKDFDAR